MPKSESHRHVKAITYGSRFIFSLPLRIGINVIRGLGSTGQWFVVGQVLDHIIDERFTELAPVRMSIRERTGVLDALSVIHDYS